MPNSPSVADVLKTKIVAQRIGSKPIGIIINFLRGEKGEISDEDIMKMLELPVYGMVPYDPAVRKSFMQENVSPVMIRKPSCPASLAIKKTAAKLSGVKIKLTSIKKKRKGLLQRILSIFRIPKRTKVTKVKK
jgi:septum site-determining protein MinD